MGTIGDMGEVKEMSIITYRFIPMVSQLGRPLRDIVMLIESPHSGYTIESKQLKLEILVSRVVNILID